MLLMNIHLTIPSDPWKLAAVISPCQVLAQRTFSFIIANHLLLCGTYLKTIIRLHPKSKTINSAA